MTLVRVYDECGDWDVDEVSDLKKRKENQFKGWRCSVGQTNIYIDSNGYIYRGRCRVGGKVSNIYNENFCLPARHPRDGWITCTKKFCEHPEEISLPKAININIPDKNSVIPIEDEPVYIRWDIGNVKLDLIKDAVVRLQYLFTKQILFDFSGSEHQERSNITELYELIDRLGHLFISLTSTPP